MRRNGVFAWLRPIFATALVLAAAILFLSALGDVRRGQSVEGGRVLEESLRRAALACYAAEGVYPPDVSYMQAHYGVQIDEGRYAVFYEVFAENLMPQITVVEQK